MNDKLKKIIPLLGLVILLVVSLVYVNIIDKTVETDPIEDRTTKPLEPVIYDPVIDSVGTINGVEYEITDNDGTNGGERTYQVLPCDCIDGPTQVFIYLGERNTGGYSLVVEDIEINDDMNVTIYVREDVPNPGDMVTQAFTYPSKAIRFKANIKNVKVVDRKGNSYTLAN